jgi:hypothetical protein
MRRLMNLLFESFVLVSSKFFCFLFELVEHVALEIIIACLVALYHFFDRPYTAVTVLVDFVGASAVILHWETLTFAQWVPVHMPFGRLYSVVVVLGIFLVLFDGTVSFL